MTSIGSHVFLAAPYSQWLDPYSGLVRTDLRERLDRLRQRFIDEGAHVFNAHHNEGWGAGWLPADKCTPTDFRAMQVADVVCAVIGSPPSGGVAVELGWASALGKPVLALTDERADCTPLILGIHTITKAQYLVADAQWSDTFVGSVVAATLTLAADGSGAPSPVTENTEAGSAGLGYVGISAR